MIIGFIVIPVLIVIISLKISGEKKLEAISTFSDVDALFAFMDSGNKAEVSIATCPPDSLDDALAMQVIGISVISRPRSEQPGRLPIKSKSSIPPVTICTIVTIVRIPQDSINTRRTGLFRTTVRPFPQRKIA